MNLVLITTGFATSIMPVIIFSQDINNSIGMFKLLVTYPWPIYFLNGI